MLNLSEIYDHQDQGYQKEYTGYMLEAALGNPILIFYLQIRIQQLLIFHNPTYLPNNKLMYFLEN